MKEHAKKHSANWIKCDTFKKDLTLYITRGSINAVHMDRAGLEMSGKSQGNSSVQKGGNNGFYT